MRTRTLTRTAIAAALVATLVAGLVRAQAPAATPAAPAPIDLKPESRIVLMGNGLGSRMVHYGHFETEMHVRFPDRKLFIRNMCDEGNTPSFRPHSGRGNQLGFPGAEKFFGPYADGNTADGAGHFETEEKWLERLKPDVLIAFFGFNESFLGRAGLDNFHAELDAFVKHTIAQKYNGQTPPRLVLVSPTAFEDRSAEMDVPNGKVENGNLAAYTSVIEAVAKDNGVLFVDALSPSLTWYEQSKEPLTADGALLNDAGYRKLADLLADRIFGKGAGDAAAKHRDAIHTLVTDKNWLWINDFKIPNGVHVFGQRYNPFGPGNYPFEIEKIREMTAIRDQAIWAAAQGKTIDIAALDAKTRQLPDVNSNVNRPIEFLEGQQALDALKVADGFKVEQFATEREFPDLANPVQLAFDNKGRLWVAVMPSYPHWRPGDPRPNDKILILEDTDGDGKADKQTIFAEHLHLPMGFEISHDGVYVSQGINLVLLRDTDGDDHADVKEIVFSGFDDHDTHHAISAFCADPSGAFIMSEGIFLRTNVETPYGPVRGTNGGFYRFSPQRRQLERHAQLAIPNPWGVAFDEWGQHFFLHTSGPTTEWMLPGSIRPRYGQSTPESRDLIEPAHRVRPTSGLEFVSSRHFPEEMQGDMLLCNAIGFLGIKQHRVFEDGTGYGTKWRQDLLVSKGDGNFRPVDLEFAPDGSLYVVDWHNPLIGHMQHSARDPKRDHAHGRIYRITYPSRPLVKPVPIDGAPIPALLDALKEPEYRTRYRARRELRERDRDQVLQAVTLWVGKLDKNDPAYTHHLVEALWVTWGMNAVDVELLKRLLASDDHRARAAATRVLRYTGPQVPEQVSLLKQAAGDAHGRVKLEAIAAASWLDKADGLAVLDAALPRQQAPKDQPGLVNVGPGGGTIEITVPPAARGKMDAFTITLPGNDRIINLAEMELYAGKKKLAEMPKLAQSSEYNNGEFPIRNLVDGNKGNFSHTSTQAEPWIHAEFGGPTSLDLIKIWNRNEFEGRFDGAKIAFQQGKTELASVEVRITDGGAGGGPLKDSWLDTPFRRAQSVLNNKTEIEPPPPVAVPAHLKGDAAELFVKGFGVYHREGFCITCHQPDGKGLEPAGFPPLAGSEWVTRQPDRLIKLTLNGLMGPIEVNGKQYPGLVPMTPFGGMLDDTDTAAVLTYVRNSFGNKADPIAPADVKRVREATKDKVGFYTPEELLKLHPHN